MKQEVEVENQRADEEIIFSMLQHPWVLAKPICIIIGVVLLVMLSFMTFKTNIYTIGILIAAALFSLIYISIIWYGYTNDLFILTNQRLIKIDQKGFFSRKVSESELDNIYNINYEIKGLVKSLLNFGDIKLSTVGDEISTITLKNIENPHYIQERVMDLHKKYKTKIYSS